MGQEVASPGTDRSQLSRAAATFVPPSAVTWAYTRRVVAELECPSMADPSVTGSPAARAAVAAVCRAGEDDAFRSQPACTSDPTIAGSCSGPWAYRRSW